MTAVPQVVTQQEWEVACADLLIEEKRATRALDALAAKRRRLPMTPVPGAYVLAGVHGPASLLDVFEGRRQLVIYHFMFAPGDTDVCRGCSTFNDNVGRLEHLHARDTTYALVSRAPLRELEAYRERMGWTVPWYSSFGTDFNRDFGVSGEDGGERFALSVLLRDGEDVFRTYATRGRGVDRLRLDFNLLDLTAFGRQETWEDSPDGWPQSPPYQWWRRHDEYETTT